MAKGIYKRGKLWWISYAGLDGGIIRESSKSEKFREAETLLIQRRQEIKEGKQPEIKRIANHTLNELAAEYIKWAERQKSFKSKYYFIKELTETFGSLPLRRFNSMLIEQWQTEKIEKGYKPATINRIHATLNHMFTKAVKWNMVEKETSMRIRDATLLKENNRRLKYLSKEECQALINSCDKHLKPIVITALHSGMRKNEVLGLRWENVDLRHGFILLNQNQTKNSERKEIPINSTLRDALQKTMRRLDTPFVFHDSTGKRYGDIKRSFKSACKRAGISDFRFHDLRHCFASHLVMAGVDLTTVKELLGHKTLTMTLRYAHLAPSHKLKAVDILDSVLTGNLPTAQKLHKIAVGENG